MEFVVGLFMALSILSVFILSLALRDLQSQITYLNERVNVLKNKLDTKGEGTCACKDQY